MKKIPNYYAKNIFEVPLSFFKKNGFKYLLCDLDNTLDTYDTLTPSERVIKFHESLKKEGLELIIISNNREKRVKPYAEVLNCLYLYSTRKPFGKKLKRFLKEHNLDESECILCGDQLITDIPCGLRAGVKTLLLDPISKKDQWTTHFNRILDKPKRKRLIKQKKIFYLNER